MSLFLHVLLWLWALWPARRTTPPAAPVGSACKHSTKRRPPAGTCSCCLSRLACHDVFVTHVGAQEEGMQSTTGVCACVCVCVCARARARVCVRVVACIHIHECPCDKDAEAQVRAVFPCPHVFIMRQAFREWARHSTRLLHPTAINKLILSLCIVCLSLLHPTATSLTGVTEPPFAGISPGSA